MKPARIILAENLTKLMTESATLRSQTQVAKRSMVSQTTIGNWLRLDSPVQSPRLEAIESVAKAFGVTVAQLLTENLGQEGSTPSLPTQSEFGAASPAARKLISSALRVDRSLDNSDELLELASRLLDIAGQC